MPQVFKLIDAAKRERRYVRILTVAAVVLFFYILTGSVIYHLQPDWLVSVNPNRPIGERLEFTAAGWIFYPVVIIWGLGGFEPMSQW
jgi:hypothetical protein